MATTPLEAALRVTGWRSIFIGLGCATLAVAAAIAWRVPDMQRPARPPSFAQQWAGVMQVFKHPRFWWIAPLGAFAMGSFMAIQGLWSVPWMMDVDGLTRAAAADRLLVLGIVIMIGYMALGMFSARLARRGVGAAHLFAGGFTLHTAALAVIVADVPGSYLWWALYGLGVGANILGFTVLNAGFAKELAARANTALNLMMFGASFLTQWGIGVIAQMLRLHAGVDAAGGLRAAFAVVLVLDILGLAWFLRGWRTHVHPAAVPAPA